MKLNNARHLLAVAATIFGFGCTVQAAETDPTFNRDIRPILSAKCFACHVHGAPLESVVDAIVLAIDAGPTDPVSVDR